MQHCCCAPHRVLVRLRRSGSTHGARVWRRGWDYSARPAPRPCGAAANAAFRFVPDESVEPTWILTHPMEYLSGAASAKAYFAGRYGGEGGITRRVLRLVPAGPPLTRRSDSFPTNRSNQRGFSPTRWSTYQARRARKRISQEDMAERVGFEPTWGGKAPNRFRVGAVVAASVPLRRARSVPSRHPKKKGLRYAS